MPFSPRGTTSGLTTQQLQELEPDTRVVLVRGNDREVVSVIDVVPLDVGPFGEPCHILVVKREKTGAKIALRLTHWYAELHEGAWDWREQRIELEDAQAVPRHMF